MWGYQMWEKSKGTTKYKKINVTCDIGTTQCEDVTVKHEKKNKGTTKCKKRTITCDIGTAQCEDRAVKCEKKSKGTTKCEKKMSCVMLELHNVRIEP